MRNIRYTYNDAFNMKSIYLKILKFKFFSFSCKLPKIWIKFEPFYWFNFLLLKIFTFSVANLYGIPYPARTKKKLVRDSTGSRTLHRTIKQNLVQNGTRFKSFLFSIRLIAEMISVKFSAIIGNLISLKNIK